MSAGEVLFLGEGIPSRFIFSRSGKGICERLCNYVLPLCVIVNQTYNTISMKKKELRSEFSTLLDFFLAMLCKAYPNVDSMAELLEICSDKLFFDPKWWRKKGFNESAFASVLIELIAHPEGVKEQLSLKEIVEITESLVAEDERESTEEKMENEKNPDSYMWRMLRKTMESIEECFRESEFDFEFDEVEDRKLKEPHHSEGKRRRRGKKMVFLKLGVDVKKMFEDRLTKFFEEGGTSDEKSAVSIEEILGEENLNRMGWITIHIDTPSGNTCAEQLMGDMGIFMDTFNDVDEEWWKNVMELT